MVKNLPAMQETPVRFLAQDDPLEKGQATHSGFLGLPRSSAGKEYVCNAWVQSLGWEDPLENEMATPSSIPAWEIPWTGACLTIVHWVAKSWT